MAVHDILESNALNSPDAVAVVDGETRISFGELFDRVRSLSEGLKRITSPGDRVGILSRNTPAYVESLYGVPAAGLVLAMLNYRLNPREWVGILNDAGARVVIVEECFAAALAEVIDDAPSVERLIVFGGPAPPGTIDYGQISGDRGDDLDEVTIADTDPAYLIYTSGTTGFPKGATISHGAATLAALTNALEVGVRPRERFLMSFPMCHASGFQVLQYHARSAEFILMRTFDPEEFLELIERHAVTRTSLAPTMASMVLDHPAMERYDTSSIATLSYGGMPMPSGLARSLAARFGELSTGFGQTESTLLVTGLTPADHRRALAGEEHLLGSCGRGFGTVGIAVLDDDGAKVPSGEVGELCVRSRYSMSGYWRNDEATRAAVAGRWLHTGDIARVDDEGFVYLVDRKRDLVISGGQNIYPTQIERVIAALPAVAEVAVVGLPDDRWGERVVAVVVRRPAHDVSAQTVIEACRRELASYKKPTEVFFVDSLPKTVTGKIQKRLVRERLLGA